MDNKRNTIQRQLVLIAVKELHKHATAEEVFECVVKKHPSISKATVYRNLRQMAESGELLNIGAFGGSSLYDFNCHDHYHFICEECRQVFDVDEYFSDLSSRIKNMQEFDIKSHTIIFKGLCEECRKNKKKAI